MGTFEGSLSVSVEPVCYPVTIAELKDHMNIDYDYHDYLIQAQLSAVVEVIESQTNRDICQRTRLWRFDSFGCDVLRFPVGPVQSITSIQYVDSAGDTQTYSSGNYALDNGRRPPVIRLGYNQTWPTPRGGPNDITVTFVTGYSGTADSPLNRYNIPDALKAAIKLMVADLYENREAQSASAFSFKPNETVDLLINPYWITYL